jgi:hypothetical protein
MPSSVVKDSRKKEDFISWHNGQSKMDKVETVCGGGHFQAGAGIFVDAYAAIIQLVHNWLQNEVCPFLH